jgi:hypothetical protein
MLAAGNTGDTNLIAVLQKYVQNRVDYATNTLLRLQQAARENPGFVPPTAAQIGLLDNDTQLEAAKQALAKLGVTNFLGEIVAELSATNSPSGKKLSRDEQFEIKARALRKLKYIANSLTIKFIGPYLYDTTDPYPQLPDARDKWVVSPLADDAIEAIRSMVTNAPAGRDHATWQQWWEQNKGKYP